MNKKIKAGLTYLNFYQAIGVKPLIISCGIPRSGSTLLFNMVRLIFEQDEAQKKVIGGWFEDYDELGTNGELYLIKAHHLSYHLGLRSKKVYFSYRDIRETMVSAKRKFNALPSIQMARNQVNLFNKAKKYADKMFSYEQLTQNKREVIEELANDLGIKVDVDKIIQSLDGFGKVEKGYSKVTLLHKNHTTGTKFLDIEKEIEPKLLAQINEEFSQWFKENGYPANV